MLHQSEVANHEDHVVRIGSVRLRADSDCSLEEQGCSGESGKSRGGSLGRSESVCRSREIGRIIRKPEEERQVGKSFR